MTWRLQAVLLSIVVAAVVIPWWASRPLVFRERDVRDLSAPEEAVYVAGIVSVASVRSDARACEHRFELRDLRGGASVPVVVRACGVPAGVHPDDLAADFEPRVHVQGSYDGRVLHAHLIYPRCWSKYAADVLYMRSCYELAGIPWEEARAEVERLRAE